MRTLKAAVRHAGAMAGDDTAHRVRGGCGEHWVAAHWAGRSHRTVGLNNHFKHDISRSMGGHGSGRILWLAALAEEALRSFRGKPDPRNGAGAPVS